MRDMRIVSKTNGLIPDVQVFLRQIQERLIDLSLREHAVPHLGDEWE
jgi:hypothetical protein